MRNTVMCVLVLLALATMMGCQTVYSDKPVGEKPVVLDRHYWEGKWLCMGKWCTIRVLDEEEGLLELRPPEGNPEGPIRVAIRESGDWQFANVRSEELKEGGGTEEVQGGGKTEQAKAREMFLWGRIENREGVQIVFWLPDGDKFQSLVEAGELPGEVTREEGNTKIFLRGLKPAHLKLIMSEKRGLLFEWDEPIALVREAERKAATLGHEEAKPIVKMSEGIAGAAVIRTTIRVYAATHNGIYPTIPAGTTGASLGMINLGPPQLDGKYFKATDYTVVSSKGAYKITATEPKSGLKFEINQDGVETSGEGYYTTAH